VQFLDEKSLEMANKWKIIVKKQEEITEFITKIAHNRKKVRKSVLIPA